MAFIPTLCEVSYDSDLFVKDRYLTPYRIPQLRNLGRCHGCGTICKQNGIGFYRFPAHRHDSVPSYYDYLKNYYFQQTRLPNDHGGSIPSPTLPSRSHTTVGWYVPITETSCTPGYHDYQTPAGNVSFPLVLKSPIPSAEERWEGEERNGESSKLVWVDALNAWLPQKQLQDKNYLSFVKTPPVIKKYFTSFSREHGESEGGLHLAPCGRFQTHMNHFRNSSPSQRTGACNLRRAVALRRKPDGWSPESPTGSRKHNRKAYSTPLSNAEDRRKHLVDLRRQQATPEAVSESPLYPTLPAWASSVSPSIEGEEDGEGVDGGNKGRLDLAVGGWERERSMKGCPAVEDETHPGQVYNDEVAVGESDRSDQEKPSPDWIEPTSQTAPVPSVRHKPKTASHSKKSSGKMAPRSSRSSQSPSKSARTPRANKPPQQSRAPSRQTSKYKKAHKKSKAVKLDKQPPSSQDEDHPQPLPVSLPTVSPPIDSDITKSESPVPMDKESEKCKGRTPVKKRERVTIRRACKSEEVVEGLAPPPEVEKRVSVLVYEEEEAQTQTPVNVEVNVTQPTLPPVVPVLPTSSSQSAINRVQKKLQAFRQPIDDKKRWGPKRRDTSYKDELRKQEIAEARRKRQAEMLDRMSKKQFNQKMEEEGINAIPSFEDYGFLAKYCILSRANLELYKHTFQAVDDERRGWLSGPEAMIALRGTNSQLTETEEEYLCRILELTGYNISSGADFKLFSVLAALSQRISSLDSWMKNVIGRMDFKTLEMKMFMCKNLWECNVDKDTNKISLNQLMIELRAGGVSHEHECEVQEKLAHLKALDLLDFLTYIPLFIMIHQSVVINPLDDTRYK